MTGQGALGAKIAAVLLWLAAALTPMCASGQVNPPPIRSSVDENGVELVSGGVILNSTDVSIGPSDGTGLSFSHYLYPGTLPGLWWTSNLVVTVSGSSSSPIVSVGASSESFTLSGGAYVANGASGSTLQTVSGQYVYTTRDGTVINFINSPGKTYVDGNYSGLLAAATTITKPNGVVTKFTYKNDSYTYCTFQYGPDCYQYTTAYFMRLSSVNNNLGYQLKLSYQSNDPGNGGWGAIDKVTAVNNAVEYCDPTLDACSFTQPWNYVQYTIGGTTVGSVSTYLITWLDRLGNGTAYTSIQDPSINKQTFALKRNGRSSDDILYTMSVSAGVIGPVTKVTKLGQNWIYGQSTDSSSNPIIRTITDPSSHTQTYRFTNYSLLGEYDDELSRATVYSYYNPTTVGNLQSVTLPGTDVITYGYDSRYNVTSVTRTAKTGYTGTISTSAAYPSTCTNVVTCNKPTSTTDERTNVTTYSWDTTTGALTQVVRPADGDGNHPTTNYGYSSLYAWYKDSSGALTSASTPIQVLTTVSRCQTNPSCASGSSDEARTTTAYEAGSSSVKSNLLPVSVSRGNGVNPSMSAAATGYDIYGNATSIDGPLSGTADTTRTYYNVSRQVTGQVGPAPGGTGSAVATHTTYRSDGQVDHVDSGTVSSPTSDPSTLTVAQTVTMGYDSYSRLIRQTLSAGGTTYAVSDRSYDTIGRTLCTAQRLNLSAPPTDACTAGTAGSDGPDRINRTTYNADGTVNYVQTGYGVSPRTVATYSYTANRKVATLTDANGNVTTQEYDGFDRVVKVRLPSSTTPGTSSTTDYQELVLDNAGNVTSRHLRGYASDPTHQFISYGYDNLGRLVTKHVGDGSISDTYYHYDLVDRLGYARFGSSSGVGITNTYDALGRLTSTVNNMGTTSRTLSYAYDPAGNRTQLTFADGNYFTYDRDALGRMTAIHENGGTLAVSTTYDSLGRMASQVRGAVTITPGYDAVSRLTSLTHDFSGTANDVTFTYAYNAAGQIKSKTRSNDAYAFAGYANATRSAPVNGLNQLTSSGTHTLGYDARGNLTTDTVSGVTTTYAYDAENHLLGVTGVATNSYDPLGRLWETVTPTKTIEFVNDGDQLVMEIKGSNILHYAHDDGGGPLLQYLGSGFTTRQSLQTDHQGSVISEADSTGAMFHVNSYDDDYGIYSSSNDGRFGYTGQALMTQLGLMYYKARVYSPTLGRFMQTDPIGYGDGPNWYGYVHGDPVNRTDAGGLDGDPPLQCVNGENQPTQCNGNNIPPGTVPWDGWHSGPCSYPPYTSWTWCTGIAEFMSMLENASSLNTYGLYEDAGASSHVNALGGGPAATDALEERKSRPLICSVGSFQFTGQELDLGEAGGLSGSITEEDSRDGVSAGRLVEGWLGGDPVAVGGGGILSTDGRSVSVSGFGFIGFSGNLGPIAGLQVGLIGNPFNGTLGVYLEGHLGKKAYGGGFYARHSCGS